jgi:hypothetical protein
MRIFDFRLRVSGSSQIHAAVWTRVHRRRIFFPQPAHRSFAAWPKAKLPQLLALFPPGFAANLGP